MYGRVRVTLWVIQGAHSGENSWELSAKCELVVAILDCIRLTTDGKIKIFPNIIILQQYDVNRGKMLTFGNKFY